MSFFISRFCWIIMSFLILFLFGVSCSDSDVEWQHSLGGSDDDNANSIQQTSDGGYIVAGSSQSSDGDVGGNNGNSDCWVVKLNGEGNLQWEQNFGGSSDDYARSVQQTTDGGFIVAGSSQSSDGDVGGNNGNADYWILKLDEEGNLQWEENFGGSSDDYARSVQQTSDGGFIVAGMSKSTDGDVSGHHGTDMDHDYWLVKLNRSGDTSWTRSLGGSERDIAYSVQQTNDGGYIVAGQSGSNDGDVSGIRAPEDKDNWVNKFYWVVKLNNSGDTSWTRSLGGYRRDIAYSIQQTNDGGYIVAGKSNSPHGNSSKRDHYNFWIVKLNDSGDKIWTRAVGGSNEDFANSIEQTSDGGYIVAGTSNSPQGEVPVYQGRAMYDHQWVVKLDNKGDKEWTRSLGGSYDDGASSIKPTTDGGYVVAGYSESSDINVSENKGGVDLWVVKLPPKGE